MKLGNVIGVSLVIVTALLPVKVSAESWRETGCIGVVESELKNLDTEKLGAAQVTYIVSSRGSAASESSEELNGWVSFENCKGNLTVQLSDNCTVTMMYTSGQCRIPGIVHY